MNLFRDADRGLVIRDWQLFRESYAEPFLEQACPSNVCCYDALPLVDGNLWNPSAIRFPGGPGTFESVEDAGNERMRIVWKSDAGGRTVILLGPESVEIEFPAEGEALLFDCNVRGAEYHRTAIFHRDGALRYRHCGEDYGFRAEKGSIVPRRRPRIRLPARRRRPETGSCRGVMAAGKVTGSRPGRKRRAVPRLSNQPFSQNGLSAAGESRPADSI